MWLLQSSGFKQSNLLDINNSLIKLGFTVKDFGLIPLTKEITNLENILIPNEKYIIRAGTKFLTLINEVSSLSECNSQLTKEQILNSNKYVEALKNGIDYNIEKFDQVNYSNIDLPLLNSSARYISYKEASSMTFDQDMFIKPSRDLKAFNGGILSKGVSVKDFILNGPHQSYFDSETIVINELKTIYAEYRFFIIDGKVITGSRYMLGNKVLPDKNIPASILDYAKSYAKLYSPADIFVMDLADTPQGIKIVEYNCWNASGIYHSNIDKLFHEVNEFKKG